MKHFSTLSSYCSGIGISKPKWKLFDIRSFEDNMKTVCAEMPPFKHEFYAVALKIDGGGYAKTGNYSTQDHKASIFFNSPYQILSWNIIPDWKGYYIIFSEDFYKQFMGTKRITEDFPFLLVDNAAPMDISNEEAELYAKLYSDVLFEFNLDEKESREIIANYLNILLHKVSRLYNKDKRDKQETFDQRNQDLDIVSRFKALIEINIQAGSIDDESHPHQVQFYADKLNLHPNHLNAIVKRITNTPASDHIYKHILILAKSALLNTSKSVKEISFDLCYNYPNHFAKFFKKQTELTPSEYRKKYRK